MTEDPFSSLSNIESWSGSPGGGSSGAWSLVTGLDSSLGPVVGPSGQWSMPGTSVDQWSLPVGLDSFWSTNSSVSLTSTDQHLSFIPGQTSFQSLPADVAASGYNVAPGQVPLVSGYDAENQLLPSNQTLDDMARYRQQPSPDNPLIGHAAPIPAFVSNASYDGLFSCCPVNCIQCSLYIQCGQMTIACVWLLLSLTLDLLIAECQAFTGKLCSDCTNISHCVASVCDASLASYIRHAETVHGCQSRRPCDVK